MPAVSEPYNESMFANTVTELINASWAAGDQKATDFASKTAALVAGMPNTVGTISFSELTPASVTPEAFANLTVTAQQVTPGVVGAFTIVEPTVDIPSTMSATDVMSVFDSKYLELVALLSEKFTTFRATHFPNEGTTYAAAEAWLAAAIANPNGGLPTAVAAQLLEDERSRVLTDAARATDAVLATFAARRFPLPPGAAASAALQIQQKGQAEIAAAGRKLTALSIEQMKFAIEKAMGMRQMAMSAAVEYIKAIASGPDMASRLVGVGYDAQSKLISSAASFYNARTEAKKAMSDVDKTNVTLSQQADIANKAAIQQADTANNESIQKAEIATNQSIQQANQANQGFIQQTNTTNATLGFQVAEKNIAFEMQLTEERVKALMAEAQLLGQMASALFNNLNTGATMSAGASSSYNTSVAGGGTLPIDPN